MLLKKIVIFLLSFTYLKFLASETWIKAGYWYSGSGNPVMEINSALFTHLVFGFAHINTSSYELSIASSSELYVFTESVKKKNPSVITLLSIWGGESEPFVGGEANSSMFFSMVSESSRRKSFIQSSITTARSYGFQGLEIFGANPDTPENMTNMGIFLDEWRAAVDKDLNHNSTSPLILTMGGYYSPVILFPADSFRSLSFDWEKRVRVIDGITQGLLYLQEFSIYTVIHRDNMWKDGNAMDFMDPSLDDASSSCKLIRCLQVALLCVQDKWEDRPSMLEVYSMLKCETEILPIPNVHWNLSPALPQWRRRSVCSVTGSRLQKNKY